MKKEWKDARLVAMDINMTAHGGHGGGNGGHGGHGGPKPNYPGNTMPPGSNNGSNGNSGGIESLPSGY